MIQTNQIITLKTNLMTIFLKKMPNIQCLSFLHLNIRNLSRNIDSLTNMMTEINTKFSVNGISETWLQDISHAVDIDGYNFVHNHRSDRTGGGVGHYLTSKLVYKTRNDLKLLDRQCAESLFIEICRPKEKSVIVGIIYRHPIKILVILLVILTTYCQKSQRQTNFVIF